MGLSHPELGPSGGITFCFTIKVIPEPLKTEQISGEMKREHN